MPSSEDLNVWLDTYKTAWETKDTPLMLSLFTEDARYFESPLSPPAAGKAAIEEYMDWGFLRQDEISMGYKIIATGPNVGVSHWNASFVWTGSRVRSDIDGIFVIHFARESKCNEFREYWHARETFNGRPVHRIGHNEKWSDGRRLWWEVVATDEHAPS